MQAVNVNGVYGRIQNILLVRISKIAISGVSATEISYEILNRQDTHETIHVWYTRQKKEDARVMRNEVIGRISLQRA